MRLSCLIAHISTGMYREKGVVVTNLARKIRAFSIATAILEGYSKINSSQISSYQTVPHGTLAYRTRMILARRGGGEARMCVSRDTNKTDRVSARGALPVTWYKW
jgi:hypothetical protein